MEGSQATVSSASSNLGKYRLIAELGHGGMAEVFLAVVRGPAGFNKLVVIKQIRPQLAEDPEFLGMFLDEARLAARLSHPNVVQTNEVGQEGERYFIAMEYLEGQPLNRVLHRLQRAGGLPLGMHLRIISEVLSGLHHAHELTDYDGTALGVVHRDITPHNIFVTYDGQVKVVDFGIAKALNSSSETRTGVLKGKVAYMAPEQARGERVDRRADIYSVGVLIWEAVTGKRMWKGVPDITILQRLLNGELPPARAHKADLSEKLEQIIGKAIAHQREDRYTTALDLQADLDAYVETLEERGNAKEIGKLITKQFEADRSKIKAIIDEQLRTKAAPPGVEPRNNNLPIIDQHTSMSGNNSGIGDRESMDNALRMATTGSNPNVADGSGSGPKANPSSYTNPSALFASAATPSGNEGSSKRGLVAAAAVGAGALLAVGLWFATRGGPEPGATTETTSKPAASAAAPATATAPAQIEVSIAANPPDARLFLDDRPLNANPYKGTMPGDTTQHQLRVEAKGFTSQTKAITLDRNVVLELALVKEGGSDKDKPTTRVIVIPAQPPPDDDAMKRTTPKPKRTLDTSNPYNK
jgi:eukaryotic-like serine/threonine-protein kinase